MFGGEGGKKVIPTGIGTYARSQNICPVHLIRLQSWSVTATAGINDSGYNADRKNFFAKRRMRAGRPGLF